MDTARIEHSVDTRTDEDEERQHEVEHLAAPLTRCACGCLRRILILLRDFKIGVGSPDTPAHRTKVAPRPYNEEHEENRQPCVKIEWNGLQKQHKAVNLCILRQGRADRRRPAGNGGDDADGGCRSVDDVGELCPRNPELIRDGAHDRADREAVEVVVDENNDAEQHSDKGGTALSLDCARCPLAVCVHCTRARDGGNEDA